MSESSTTDTKTSILDAAEMLFVEKGFDGTSLRSVVAKADVNIAAVHYHFGSKESLIQAVLARRLEPINRERLERLAALRESNGKGELQLEDVLRALFEPALRLAGGGEPGSNNIVRLIGRIFSEPSHALQLFLKDRFRDVFENYTSAFREILTELPDLDFYWRIHFMLGAMCHTLCDRERPVILSGGVCDVESQHEVLEQLVAFVAGGLRAQSTGGK
ncbi:MAG: TetR family transcriptional regulator [Verrucomicrobia bacterium]|jgi:AcrR family transcriptional regulator|nr:TetR family transcriptional regulator [Verrucomicrobiota bacterium]